MGIWSSVSRAGEHMVREKDAKRDYGNGGESKSREGIGGKLVVT